MNILLMTYKYPTNVSLAYGIQPVNEKATIKVPCRHALFRYRLHSLITVLVVLTHNAVKAYWCCCFLQPLAFIMVPFETPRLLALYLS